MSLNPNQFEGVWGKGVESIFPEGSSPVRPAPWPRAGQRKDRAPYDQSVVHEALRNPPRPVNVDPRTLSATQSSITQPGVSHYASNPEWKETGRTYADQGNPGNRFPVVYSRDEGNGGVTHMLLSGHHRGAAALVNGEQLPAIQVKGPWGPKYDDR